MEDDLIYLLRRAGEERGKASESVSEGARRAHLGLADAYDAKLRGKSPTPLSGRLTG